jgi:hypothetical protein
MQAHYLPSLLCRLFSRHKDILTVSNYHQTTNGWVTILKCEMTGQEYIMNLLPIKKELMYSDFEKGTENAKND